MVQPSAPRVTAICSVPIGAPRRKIVKFVAPASCSGGAAAGCCADAPSGRASASAASVARIEWNEGMPQHNTMIPAVSAAAYDAARHRAAFLDRSHRGRIVVSGTERASYLQGLLTNDVVALKAGQGCYAAYLTAQGRMIADLHVYELGDVMLLTMTGDVKDGVLAKLDQFIFTEDVQLGDVTGHVRADRGRRPSGGAGDRRRHDRSVPRAAARSRGARQSRTHGTAARRSSRASPTQASPVSICTSNVRKRAAETALGRR